MEYRVLARKWRPQVFDEVVGQDHVVKTLKNAINLDRIAHAYLFSGPRGTGKTSVARILAKSVNCEKGPAETPCNECSNCREITDGSSLDVREIDGASNRGIDEIRELRENIKFSPAASRYKIYIIDEVHMLTKEAFNALLKTLEEPPSHVIFVFATTEIYKVPVTILSRCQHFDFKRISLRQIIDNLGMIAKAEKITVSDEGLTWIAKGGEGSLRDAQSIFDQVISYAGMVIKESDVEELLGLSDRRFLAELSRAVLARDAGRCLKIVDEVYYSGMDIKQFYQMFLNHCMNLLTVKITEKEELLMDLSDHERGELQKISEGASRETLQRLLDMLIAEEDDIRKGLEPRLNMEYVLVKMAYLEPMIPVDEILSRMEALEKKLKPGSEEKKSAPERVIEPEKKKDIRAETRREDAIRVRDRGDNLWDDFKDYVKKKSNPLWSKIVPGKLLGYDNRCMTIGFPEGYIFLESIMEKSQKKLLARIAGEFFGEDVSVKIKSLEGVPNNYGNSSNGTTKAIENLKSEALKHPLVQKVLDVFEGAEIRDVIVKNKQ
jgi:DNA polymerase-3 subunit gamma/tau